MKKRYAKPFLEWISENVLFRLVMNGKFQIFIAFAWIGSVIFCGFQISQMKEGLELSRAARFDSNTGRFFRLQDEHFRRMNFRIQVVITEDLDYGDIKVQHGIEKLLKQFLDLPLISNDTDLVEDWLKAYKSYDGYDPDNFNQGLSSFLRLLKKTPLPENVKFSPDGKRIYASRFVIQSTDIQDSPDEMELGK